jgi:hypothetical protein
MQRGDAPIAGIVHETRGKSGEGDFNESASRETPLATSGRNGPNLSRIRLNVAFRYVAQWSRSASTQP